MIDRLTLSLDDPYHAFYILQGHFDKLDVLQAALLIQMQLRVQKNQTPETAGECHELQEWVVLSNKI